MLFLVPAQRMWRDFFRGEFPRHIANRNLVLVESEMHSGLLIFVIIARSEAKKQSILPFRGKMDCFAALAMTAWATSSIHRRDRELRAFLDAGRAARRDRPGLCIQPD